LYGAFVKGSKKPSDALVMAEFLGRRGRLKEAINIGLGDPITSTMAPEAVGQACIKIISDAPPDPEQAGGVADWLQRAIEKTPSSTSLLVELAMARRIQGRDEDAIAAYRQALGKEPENFLVQNNLAWILATRGPREQAEAAGLIDRAIRKQ